jgi:RNA polymerase sigma factor (sigma-70 family)
MQPISSTSGYINMTTQPPGPVTELLAAVGRGDAAAHERLWSLVYDELHRVAKRQMAGERPGRTLQTTVLVNETYLKLVGHENVQWANRRHFFAAAAKAMRQIRIDDARRRNRLKRGGAGIGTEARRHEGTEGGSVGVPPVGSVPHPQRGWGTPPVEDVAVFDQDPVEVLAVDEALRKLEQTDPRKAEVVMLRYFAGLNREEIAEALGVSASVVDKDWRFARTWLYKELTT